MTLEKDTENTAADLASRFINNTGRHIFLTGKAGTGKTTFLKYITRHTHKTVVIAAPTGIAAINAGGVTLHSLFQLPFGAFVPSAESMMSFPENVKINTPSSLLKSLQINGTKRRIIQEMELLIIDEVSMLRADLLDAIDIVLRSIRKQRHLPFGGLQILFIGDLLQLPPVVKEDEWRYLEPYYNSPYFFDAQALQKSRPVYIEFDKIYRQQDQVFIDLLNDLRTNQVTEEDIKLLNGYYKPGFKSEEAEGYINLTTHNYKADTINKAALQKLEGESFLYRATIEGEFNESAYPMEPVLELKNGAQVMFIKNDPTGEKRFFNGKIGKVIDLDADKIIVSLDDSEDTVSVERYTWENMKYSIREATNEIEEHIAGSFTQYPIRLAWAITVHKSQGLTFKKAVIDIGSAFVSGQAYVALSRLVSLDGLVLLSPIRVSSLNPDATIVGYADTQPAKERLPEVLDRESVSFFRNYVMKCFDFSELENKLKNHHDSYQKDELKSAKQKHRKWAAELSIRFSESAGIAEKFLGQLSRIFDSGGADYKNQLYKRISSAKKYFQPVLKQYSQDILKHKELVKSDKKVKKYLGELDDLDIAFYKQTQLIIKAEAMAKSAIDNAEYSKEVINTDQENQERLRELRMSRFEEPAGQAYTTSKETRGRKQKKANKLESGISDTKNRSFEMYLAGKTIPEIAVERGFAVGTIEGHLAHYVGMGLLDISVFVSPEKKELIARAAESVEEASLSAIKQQLGDEATYTEIRFVMAEMKRKNQSAVKE